jgi:hypothetical protein
VAGAPTKEVLKEGGVIEGSIATRSEGGWGGCFASLRRQRVSPSSALSLARSSGFTAAAPNGSAAVFVLLSPAERDHASLNELP